MTFKMVLAALFLPLSLVEPAKGVEYFNGRFFDGACVSNVTTCFLQAQYDINNGAYSKEGNIFACLSPNNTDLSNPDYDRDDTLILCDCKEEDAFFLDIDPVTASGVFRWTRDEHICLQAGHEDVSDGSWIRLYPCNRSEPRQVLWYVSNGEVRLTSNPTLCMVPQGDEVDMCQSHVIVKECDSVRPERRSWQFRTRETVIRQVLGPVVVGEGNPFPNSEDQELSLNWLVYEDEATIPQGPKETYQLLQRYVSSLLYYATDGPNWFNSSLWLTNTTVCDWDGVICSEDEDSDLIDSYNLDNNNLSGPLASELGTLSELISLNLSDNLLDGAIPEALGNLLDLKSLSLACNMLTGYVPKSLTSLTRLEDLCLGGNDFNATELPGALGDIPCLSASEECSMPFEEVSVAISRAVP